MTATKVLPLRGLAFVLAACGSTGGASSTQRSTGPAISAATATATSAPMATPKPATSAPTATPKPATPAPTATPKPAGPTLTEQQKEAVAEAQQYLSTGAFSQQGLIDQLDSPDGGGFSVNDATVAVDSLAVNWSAEAVQAATGYLQTEAFSQQGVIDQLNSPDVVNSRPTMRPSPSTVSR